MKYMVDITVYGWECPKTDDFEIGWGIETKQRCLDLTEDQIAEWVEKCINRYGSEFVQNIRLGKRERKEWWTVVKSGMGEFRKDIWFRVLSMN